MAVFVFNHDSKNVVDLEYLKITSNMIFSYAYDAVSKYPEPKREDYQSEAEFKKAYNDYLMILVEYVSKIKFNVFSDVLNSYNESISIEHDLLDNSKRLIDKINSDVNYFNGNIRRAVISTIICCLICPVNMIPLFIGLGLGRYAINKAHIKRSMVITQQQKEMLKQFRDDKDKIYVFQDDLRTDYHKRKVELEELKKMILDGKVNRENKDVFIDKLRSLINPEGYDIAKFDDNYLENRIFLLKLLGKDVALESPAVQLVKK